jgi:HEAT repeat protein
VLLCVCVSLLGVPRSSLAQETHAKVAPDARGEEAFNKALGRLGSTLASERAEAADELGRRGYRFRKQIADVLRPMLRKDVDAVVRAAAGRALGRLGAREAVPELIEALGDASADVRVVAAAALWRLPDPQAVPALLERAHDEDAKVREWAALALGVAADARAQPVLVSLLADRERSVRLSAVRALGRVNRVESLAPLEKYLASSKRDEEEKEEVVNAVASVDSGERVATLLSLYAAAASDLGQKKRLLRALARAGDAQAIPMLRKLAQREDGRGLRAPAVAALSAILARTGDAGVASARASAAGAPRPNASPSDAAQPTVR